MTRTSIHDTPELRAMWASDVPLREIAHAFGVTEGGMRFAARRFGLPNRDHINPAVQDFWTPEKDQILRDYDAGKYHRSELPGLVGRSLPAIDARRKKIGLTKPRPPKGNLGQEIRAKAAREAPKDTSLAGRLRDTKGSYAALAKIAKKQGWTQVQVQQRYHRAVAGESV